MRTGFALTLPLFLFDARDGAMVTTELVWKMNVSVRQHGCFGLGFGFGFSFAFSFGFGDGVGFDMVWFWFRLQTFRCVRNNVVVQ